MQNKSPEDILKELRKPFTIEVAGKTYPAHKWKPQTQAGNRFICVPYLDRSLVSDRLNEVFGLTGWQFDVKREDDATKTGTLSIFVDGKWISRSDTGTPSKEEGEKGSTSDALKRCARLFGIGEYLDKIQKQWIEAKPNHKNKLTPVDKNGKFLYGDALTHYCNQMSSNQGILAQLLINKPELWERQEIKNLWNELKNS